MGPPREKLLLRLGFRHAINFHQPPLNREPPPGLGQTLNPEPHALNPTPSRRGNPKRVGTPNPRVGYRTPLWGPRTPKAPHLIEQIARALHLVPHLSRHELPECVGGGVRGVDCGIQGAGTGFQSTKKNKETGLVVTCPKLRECGGFKVRVLGRGVQGLGVGTCSKRSRARSIFLPA